MLLNLLSKKVFLVCFLVFVAKPPIPTVLKNRASSHQIIIFIYIVCAVVDFVIYFFRNLLLNNDCVLIFFHFDYFNETHGKNQKSYEIRFGSCHQNYWFQICGNLFCHWIRQFQTKKKLESAVQHIGLKYWEFQQVFAKQKRLREIWGFFDFGKNDLLNQKIRNFRVLDQLNIFSFDDDETEFVESFAETVFNENPELYKIDFSKILDRFDFSPISVFLFATFRK